MPFIEDGARGMIGIGNRPVLLTGAAGFLGGHIYHELFWTKGATVWAPPRRECDLRDESDCHHAVASAGKDCVIIHAAAAVGGIEANRMSPAEFIDKNLQMGLNVLNAAVGIASKVVLVGTTCSYPKHCPVPFREADLWAGYPEETNAPYGIAKRTLIAAGQAYREQYGLNVISVIPANLYGPGDNFDPINSHVIPAMIRRFIEAVERGAHYVSCWGTGAITRDLLHVRDAARGIVDAAEQYDSSDPVNIGTGQELSVKEIASQIALLVGYKGEIGWDASKPDGQPRRCLDITRAKESFGFSPQITFSEGLAETVEWYCGQRIVA